MGAFFIFLLEQLILICLIALFIGIAYVLFFNLKEEEE